MTTTDGSQDWSLYPYKPIKALPIIFAIILLILILLQLYQTIFKYRWRRFYITMIFASTCWLAGFICRVISIHMVQNVDVFVTQYVLLFVAPPFYAGAEYFILGRVFAYVPYHTPIHPGRVLSTFLVLEAAVEVLSANGAAAVATAHNESDRNSAYIRMEVSLILQSCLEACFFSLVVLLQIRCRRANNFPTRLRTVSRILYITSAMMLVRCIFRIVETFESTRCSVNTTCATVDLHEWYFWVFEVANITVYVALLTIFPPGKYLPPNDKVYLDPLENNIERMGPGFAQADKRKFWVTVADPFDLKGNFSSKGKALDRFWERQNPVYSGESHELEPKPDDETRLNRDLRQVQEA